MKKRSININGHATSVTLEEEFWQQLKQTAKRQTISLNKLITEIDKIRQPDQNLSSAIRVFILQDLLKDR